MASALGGVASRTRSMHLHVLCVHNASMAEVLSL